MKSELRSQKLLERLSHHPQEKEKKDDSIVQTLSNLPEFKRAKNILLYLPIHGEVNLKNLFHINFSQEKKFILPRVEQQHLHLYYISNLDETEPGRFKILEPKRHLQRANVSEVELALIPGVVFSKNGHRVGYGKGFYDRLLKEIICIKIGVAYDFQIVENIDGELHDVPMDMVVTEREIIKTWRGNS